MSGRAARASDAHEEVTEAIVEPFNVGQHAHERMVKAPGAGVYSARPAVQCCMAADWMPVRRCRRARACERVPWQLRQLPRGQHLATSNGASYAVVPVIPLPAVSTPEAPAVAAELR